MTQKFDIVAVGSGHNGLVAAAYLAAVGKRVLVLERNAWLGGGVVTRELTAPGFRHDQHSVGHIFIQANPLLQKDELKLLSKYGLKYEYPAIPMMSVFDDGSTLALYRDRQKNYEEIAKFSKRDADSYLKFSELAARYLPMLIGTLYSAPAPVGASYAMMDQSREGREMFATMMKSGWDIILEWFEHEKVRLHFARMLGENLHSPEEQGSGIGLFMFLSFLEKYGMGIPVGGSGALTAALVRCIEDHGGTVLTETDVSRIVVRDGRARTVETSDGQIFEAADGIIGAIHPHLLRKYIDGIDPAVTSIAEKTKTSYCACFTVHASLNEKLAFKAGDHVQEAAFVELLRPDTMRFRRSFDEVRYGQIPRDPLIGLISPTNFDPSRAPAGKATLHAWDYVPYQISGHAPEYWDEYKERYAHELIGEMGNYISNLSSSNIIGVHMDSPLDMERTSASFQRGDLHGIAGYLYQFGAHRPTPDLGRNTVPGVDRFYLVGPFQHPGGGVFGAGRATAMRMFDDLKMDFQKSFR
ncbi:hypothetical protein CIC12_20345 [Burkholderia sp. SG-MS1]|uniref:phytoene desaturase family protein n=1 Tax=Paraburkholderia sp. SG-MS1 TaxID=2023741 RepID=UPI0014483F0D|nr:NAD(P)/FAD-dependent oxidoreductase [Paraburkholderia sp. SG-MS1]NKJ49043.1 hypothetical protein [Paraburkholderia sp. SG-MS1]